MPAKLFQINYRENVVSDGASISITAALALRLCRLAIMKDEARRGLSDEMLFACAKWLIAEQMLGAGSQ
ncbi:hypothetical protein [Pseudomonas sp. NFIX28]|uniref:hypothetical protein n=1 Tax=Pseudomonas sp. NFIX28 TaxID=1566235 RepID=UPI000B84ED07|nr:hypothetical protein [Pseudomonas sp. NFIX28]